MRRIDNLSVGIGVPRSKTRVSLARSDCRSRLHHTLSRAPTMPWNPCPPSRGNPAHDHVESMPTMPWNTHGCRWFSCWISSLPGASGLHDICGSALAAQPGKS